LLCIAADLTLPGGFVTTRSVAEWKKKPPMLDRRPAVFLLSRAAT
jgi:16S rRNA (cytidine1402-2'-O)-methyltransferase